MDAPILHAITTVGILEKSFRDGLIVSPNPIDGKFVVDWERIIQALKWKSQTLMEDRLNPLHTVILKFLI